MRGREGGAGAVKHEKNKLKIIVGVMLFQREGFQASAVGVGASRTEGSM
jgi:hypothetical protein